MYNFIFARVFEKRIDKRKNMTFITRVILLNNHNKGVLIYTYRVDAVNLRQRESIRCISMF